MPTDLEAPENREDQSVDKQWFEQEFGGRADSQGFQNAHEEMGRADTGKSLSPGALGKAEGQTADDNIIGEGYKPNDKKRLDRVRRLVRGGFKNKKLLIGGGAGIGIVSLLIFLFVAIIPLKILSIVEGLQNRFFSSSKSAVQNETDKMFESYFKGPVGDAMRKGNCSKEGNVIVSKDCTLNLTSGSSNPVVNLYKTWSQSKLENILADTYGIELKYDTSGTGTFYLKAPSINGESKVGDGVNGIGSSFDEVDRGTVRQAFKDAEQNMTLWDKVMFRYKVGRYLEEKYAIKRCEAFCGAKDALTDGISNRKNAAKLFLVERVITPHNAALGAVINCILNTTTNACTNKEPTSCAEGDTCNELANEPMTQADTDTEKAIGDASSSFGSETASKLISNISDIRDSGGFQNYVLKKIISQVFNQDVAENAVPVVGQLQTLSSVSGFISKLSTAPTTLKKLSYVANASAAVSLYMMYRSYADEMRTGHVDATEVGSFTNSLGPGNQCDPNQGSSCNQLGGTADAAGTPLYSYLLGSGSSPSSASSTGATSFLNNLLSPSVYAAPTTGTSTSTSSYTCADGSGVKAGSLVCPEEVLGQGNGVINSISSSLNSLGLSGLASGFNAIMSNPIISVPMKLLNNIGAWFSGTALSIFKSLPGTSQIINAATNKAGQFTTFLTSKLIPSPFSSDMSGGRTFDMMAAGADVSGNDYAHIGLGGQKLSPQQVAEITNQQESEAQAQFSHQPLLTRMFSTNSQYSLISKLALDMPSSRSSLIMSFGSLLSNPLSSLAHGFAVAFSGNAAAAAIALPDAFGVTQYGYPDGTIPPDPLTYWEQHCSDNVAQAYQNDSDYQATGGGAGWNGEAASGTPDPDNGMSVNTTPNPCLLIKATTGSAGGALDSNLLTQDDRADINNSSGGSSGTSSCGNSGKYSALVGSGSNFAGVDQGIDFTPSGSSGFDICAPAPGTITLSDQTGHHFDRTNGQAEIIEKLDQPPNASNSSQYIYYAESIQIDNNVHVGTHVNAGDLIGHNDQNPGIEIGWGQSPTEGFLCPIGSPTACGSSFDNWVQGLSTGKGL